MFTLGEIAKLLLAWLGNPKRALATVALSSGVALSLGLRYPLLAADVMKDRPLLGLFLALIVSLCGLVTYGVEALWKRYRILSRLRDLTRGEEAVLRTYLEEKVDVLPWERAGGAVEVLKNDGILDLVTSGVDIFKRRVPTDSYRIDPVAWKHLRAHPELVSIKPTPIKSK